MFSILERVCLKLLEMERAIVPQRHARELLRPGLKVLHDDSRMQCTIVAVGSDGLVLRTPEGSRFEVSFEEFSKDYSVD